MTRLRKSLVGFALVLGVAAIGTAAWIGVQVLHTVRRLPEAYAAWDTGTLLVAYMQAHDDRWPRSWDDLLTVMDGPGGRDVPLHGALAGDVSFARSLRSRVAVGWTFDPRRPGAARPVTLPGGGAFPVVWQGAEPNDMVREYLRSRAATRPTTRG